MAPQSKERVEKESKWKVVRFNLWPLSKWTISQKEWSFQLDFNRDEILNLGSVPSSILGSCFLIFSGVWSSSWAGCLCHYHYNNNSSLMKISTRHKAALIIKVLSLGAAGVVFPPVSEQEFLLHTRPRWHFMDKSVNISTNKISH